jgi:hypothetical protein
MPSSGIGGCSSLPYNNMSLAFCGTPPEPPFGFVIIAHATQEQSEIKKEPEEESVERGDDKILYDVAERKGRLNSKTSKKETTT